MANTRLTDLTAITTPAAGDKIYLVDVSDTTDNAAGSSRQITLTNLFAQVDEINTDLVTLTGTQSLSNKTLTAPVFATSADLNGVELILDADADTSITADTDDQIDIKIAGADDFRFTANQLDILSGSTLIINGTLDANGTEVIIDADADTSVTADTDDQLDYKLGGSDRFRMGTSDFDIVTATGNIQVAATDPWRTITLTPGFLKPTTTSGCAASTTVEAGTNDIDYDVLDFDTASDENAYCNFQLPDSYDGGVIQFRYIWTNASGLTTETVVFELSGRAYADSDAIDQAVGTAVEVSDTWLAQGDIHTSAWSGNVTLAGTPAGGQWVHIEVMRDVSEDNLTGDARLIGVQIRYKQSQFTD